MTPVDRAFRRYRRSGDAAAAAAVFDATAADLLRLAMHLLRDAEAAEDAVQETFLAVLGDHAGFDEARSFRPWATGILVNRCRRALTRRQHERSTRPLDDEPTGHAGDEPSERAAGREWIGRVHRALAEVPQPFRSALELRLAEDLEPTVIAARLGRRASTVRTQLQRGMEHLRRGLSRDRLPMAAVLPLPALTRIRGEVLGPLGAPPPPTSIPTRWPAAPRLAAALVATTLTAVALLGWWRSDEATAPPGHAAATPLDSQAHATEVATAPDRDRRTVSPPPRTTGDPMLTRLVGRCRDAESGEWLAGCRIRLEAHLTDTRRPRRAAPLALPEPAVTDAEGHFALTLRPDALHRVTLHIEADGRAPWAAHWDPAAQFLSFTPDAHLIPGTEVDLGTIVMRTGERQLAIRIVDRSGAPMPGVSFTLGGMQSAPAGHAVESGRSLATSDASGLLRLASALPAGRHAMSLVDSRFVAVEMPGTVDIPTSPNAAVAVVAARPALHGTLRDPRGTACGGVALTATDQGGAVVARGRSRGDGSFTLRADRLEPTPVTLNTDGDPAWTLLEPEQTHWLRGQTVSLIAERTDSAPALLRVHVVDAVDGEPIPAYHLSLGSDPSRPPADGRFRIQGLQRDIQTDDDPTARLPIHQAGPAMLFVHADVTAWAPRGGISLDVTTEDEELTVQLQPTAAREALVLDPDGEPLAGAWVELLRVAPDLDAPPGPVAEAWRREQDHEPARLDATFSDADGHARVFAAVDLDPERLVIRASHPRFSMAMQRLATATATATSRLRLGPPTGVVGTFSGLEELRGSLPSLQAQRLGAGATQHAFRHATLGSDGRFALLGLAPGPWRLSLVVHAPGPTGAMLPTTLEPPLAEVLLAPGERLELQLDGSRWRPATLRGEVRLADDHSPQGGHVYLLRPAPQPAFGNLPPNWGLRVGHAAVDAAGEFELAGVPPGRWELRFQPAAGGALRHGTAPVELAPGEDRRGVFVFPSTTRRVLVLSPDGTPYASQLVRILIGDQPQPGFTRTDATGHAELRWPPGIDRLSLCSLDQSLRGTTHETRDHAGAATVQLQDR